MEAAHDCQAGKTVELPLMAGDDLKVWRLPVNCGCLRSLNVPSSRQNPTYFRKEVFKWQSSGLSNMRSLALQ